jgi:uncharacterized damage-inducible protein DinB
LYAEKQGGGLYFILMDLLDRLLGHDLWTTRQLILECRSLTGARLDQPFDVNSRTLRQCFTHIISAMESWNDLLYQRPVRAASTWGAQPPPLEALLAALDAASQEFSALSKNIARDGRWDDTFTDVLDHPPRQKTFGGAIAHVLTHNMHHRAQAMFMMEQLGLRDHIEGDVLSWEQTAHGSTPD